MLEHVKTQFAKYQSQMAGKIHPQFYFAILFYTLFKARLLVCQIEART